MSEPDRQSPAPQAADAGPSVVSNTALALATQVISAALTALLTLYLTRALHPREFGQFSLAVSVASVLIVAVDAGIAVSAPRFIAERRDDLGAAARILSNALTLKLGTGVVTSGALFALAVPLAQAYGDHGLVGPFRALAIALFGQNLLMLYSAALVSVQRIKANMMLYFSEGVVETFASILLVALGAGAAGAAVGRTLGYVGGAVAAMVLGARVFGRRAVRPRRVERSVAGPLLRYAGVLFLVSGAWTLFSQVDILFIGVYRSSAEVAFFSAPLRLCSLLHYPGLAVQNSVAPRLARRAGREPDVRTFEIALRGLVILQAAMVAPALVWARPILHLLLGAAYDPSAPVLRGLAPFLFLQGIGPVVSVGVNFLGESRHRIWIAVAAFVIDLLLDVILIPPLGALGGAIATSVAYAVYVPAHLLICRRLLDMSLRPLVITTARALLAAAAASGVLLLVGSYQLTVADWAVGGLGGLAAFAAVLLLTREITPMELRTVGRWVRARVG